MPVNNRKAKGHLLAAFQTTIEKRTQGRLSQLCVDSVDGQFVAVVRAATYYAAQLAIAAIREFTSDNPESAPASLTVHIDEHTMVINTPRQDKAEQSYFMNLPPRMPTRLSEVVHKEIPKTSATYAEPIAVGGQALASRD